MMTPFYFESFVYRVTFIVVGYLVAKCKLCKIRQRLLIVGEIYSFSVLRD